MRAQHTGPSSADVAWEANSLGAGLGIVTFAIFPLALPGLLLFVVAPLALVAMVGVLLATPFFLAIWLVRMALRSRCRRRNAAFPASDEIRTIAADRVPRSCEGTR